MTDQIDSTLTQHFDLHDHALAIEGAPNVSISSCASSARWGGPRVTATSGWLVSFTPKTSAALSGETPAGK
jgi:hypothetical protein